MKKIVFYIVFITAVYLFCLGWIFFSKNEVLLLHGTGFLCAIIGGLGGCMYCMRGIYRNKCVNKKWDNDWHVWYALRPLVSLGSGAVSFIFLKAGLLFLESGIKAESSNFGFYALAFIAGYNVDNFLKKVEEVFESILGVKKSNISEKISNNDLK